MFLNVKLDTRELHVKVANSNSLVHMGWLKRSRQYWHSCIVGSLWKTRIGTQMLVEVVQSSLVKKNYNIRRLNYQTSWSSINGRVFTIRKSDTFLSDYLTDLKLHRPKNILSKIGPAGFELMTSWSSVSCSANWTREESVGDFWSELSFVSCTTLHVGLSLFLESIGHDFIKALMIHTHNQIVT